ncbi:urea amidolyase family protein, partial [Leucobacter sp. M11]|uniref:5-oxoprolinase subunit B/C family protein n=1 Tax=Leucobacter sp. M11 TaxID=2993565 RepID=UPI002D7E5511
MSAVRLLPAGRDATLVDLADLGEALRVFRALNDARIPGVWELVPAARTVLVRHRPWAAEAVRHAAQAAAAAPSDAAGASREAPLVELPVRYVGADLAEVAALLGIAEAEVIERHTGQDWQVAFTGFAPGFAYLTSPGAGLTVPRRSAPRTRIPAGSVGLAGEFSGVYPRASPGGWQLIGVTSRPMWDLTREIPALLIPGGRVRFVAEETASAVPLPEPAAGSGPGDAARQRAASPAEPAAAPDAGPAPALRVLAVGPQSLIQDLGRPGVAALGVSGSGVLDAGALRAGNRLVGNPVDAAGIEAAYGGLELLSEGDALVALTGAPVPAERIDAAGTARAVPMHTATPLAAGERLRLGAPSAGVRTVLAVRGGIAAPPVLGSRASDTLAALGPAPLAAGDRLPLGPVAGLGLAVAAVLPEAPPVGAELPAAGAVVTLRVHLGPRDDWFAAAARDRLLEQPWRVTPQSDRVGLRLSGSVPLDRAPEFRAAELPSEGTVPGAIQVPADGQPVLFLADHPLTGGYPVIAVLDPADRDLAGQ